MDGGRGDGDGVSIERSWDVSAPPGSLEHRQILHLRHPVPHNEGRGKHIVHRHLETPARLLLTSNDRAPSPRASKSTQVCVVAVAMYGDVLVSSHPPRAHDLD